MWKGLHVTTGDLVVFLDADVTGFDTRFVLGLAGPLLAHDDVDFVKASYVRHLWGRPGEGGRVTELTARPLIRLLFPHLAAVRQPLAGECAGRREVLESVPFVAGYGVDLGLLIDLSARFGAGVIAQCDLGTREHRNRPLSELAPQAEVIMRLGLERARLLPAGAGELPPLSEVPAHRKTA
jgi:glucosyl-3-phosphoglycerate synthase